MYKKKEYIQNILVAINYAHDGRNEKLNVFSVLLDLCQKFIEI